LRPPFAGMGEAKYQIKARRRCSKISRGSFKIRRSRPPGGRVLAASGVIRGLGSLSGADIVAVRIAFRHSARWEVVAHGSPCGD
jgi:hypothetical protein